ncbi:MAG: hypothetical protein PWQ37_2360 [Candidatus Petromonas sp.]|jgi:hypothetical protein|nr:hypothetical protein [Candidatus Petromonas sp.]
MNRENMMFLNKNNPKFATLDANSKKNNSVNKDEEFALHYYANYLFKDYDCSLNYWGEGRISNKLIWE